MLSGGGDEKLSIFNGKYLEILYGDNPPFYNSTIKEFLLSIDSNIVHITLNTEVRPIHIPIKWPPFRSIDIFLVFDLIFEFNFESSLCNQRGVNIMSKNGHVYLLSSDKITILRAEYIGLSKIKPVSMLII